ncbi:hypothetical protein P8C59_005369 [Phyllachora maydis]|uniref:DNA-directed RNA polymerase subunit n=1 Tax=Phyllachora maydis TaxID=1825666 RepID=A0AAD9MEF9_9PEZI|nr:hypothetical protein P8C59_005369 [Phyllachora maydis]
MNVSKPVGSALESVEFTFLSKDEIHAISARRIENEQTFDNLNNPIPGGLYDPALGSWGDSVRCATCNLLQAACPGHPGHIDLATPVYHPVFMDQLFRLLRAQCVYCQRLRLPRDQLHRYSCILRLLQHGLLREAQMIDALDPVEFGSKIRQMMTADVTSLLPEDSEEEDVSSDSGDGKKAAAREEFVRRALRRGMLSGSATMAIRGKHEGALAMRREVVKEFFAEIIRDRKCATCSGVSPSFRRDRFVKIFERDLSTREKANMAQQNKKRVDVVVEGAIFQTDKSDFPHEGRLADMDPEVGDGAESESGTGSEGEGEGDKLDQDGRVISGGRKRKSGRMPLKDRRFIAAPEVLARLNLLFDKEQKILGLLYNSKPTRPGPKRNEEGIKQKLEKKEGLFRKNMMGKRVNFAARSVISPDPNIETNEIGVPPVFACKLTYPEPVTSHNFKDMQQAVINGVDKWPGATSIETESGQIIHLGRKSLEDRIALANQLLAPTSTSSAGLKNKKVHRHLSNGDVVLMNRQPTLHKPSIMGHRVRVLPGERTIRMHYANCNTYNADFDGDEMNMHFPQNEIARAEALQIADTDHQYISATAGRPLRGLIQDHLSVSVALCNKDTLFALVRPVVRWTGKQVITTILKNIKPLNCGDLWMTGKSSVKGDRWGTALEEGDVAFRNGEFVTGILDKAQLGPSPGGLVHSIHEVYGPAVAGKFLSAMGRLLTRYLNMTAFTCGMDDLRLTRTGETTRREKLRAASRVGLEVAVRYVSLQDGVTAPDDPELLRRLEDVMRDDTKQEGLDLLLNQGCSSVSSSITTSCLPDGLEKKFPRNQMQSMTTSGAKGTQVNANLISCNLGQQVLEGRRVPIMVSGKTLPCFRPFDTDVRAGGYVVNRFLTGIRPQEYFFHLMAGREGLIDTAVKTSRSGYLQRCIIKGMEGLEVSYDSSVRDSDGSICQFLYGEDGLDMTKQKYLFDFEFVLRNRDSELSQIRFPEASAVDLFRDKDSIVREMKDAIKSTKSIGVHVQDPITSVRDPARFAFATSEAFFCAMSDYVKKNPDRLIKEKGARQPSTAAQVARKVAEKLFALKYQRSLVEPGEAVGIVAGQSIGEPSTQMTLNTFHLAGHSAKNVTLGIPRLREILMTASANIATPTMTLVLNEELSQLDGERFAKAISVLSLSDVLDSASVREHVGRGKIFPLAKIYQVRLRFFPASEYAKMYAVAIDDVLDTVERKFLPLLEAAIKKAVKRAKNNEAAMPEVGTRTAAVLNEGSAGAVGRGRAAGGGGDVPADDSDDDGDGDATAAKQRANRSEAVSYGPNDEEDDAIQNAMAREASSDPEDDAALCAEPAEDGATASVANEEKVDEVDVKVKNEFLACYRCDRHGGEWCELTLELDAAMPKFLMIVAVQETIRKSLIQQIAGVGLCTFVPDEKIVDPRNGNEVPTRVVHTQGANLRAMQLYGDYIDPNRISSNDCAAVLAIYGVEACRANIVRELHGVFRGHGISVDMRHLSLIADYMTRNGGFSPFNRMGLASSTSPFTKMSFETTLSFLKDAVLDGDWDVLNAPSSRLVVGKLGKVGTGLFDVYTAAPTRHLGHAG